MHLVTLLRIHTLDLDQDFTDALRELKPREGFIHEISEGCGQSLPVQTLRARDLVLVGEKALAQPEKLPSQAAVLVKRTAQPVPADVLERFLAIWCSSGKECFLFSANRYLDQLEQYRNLHLKEIYFETMLALTPALSWFKNVDGLHFSVSATFSRTVKKSREDVEGKGHAYIWGMDEKEYENSPLACKESDARVLSSGKIDVTDELVQSQRGIRTFSTWKGALRDDDGAIIGTAGVAHDVTDMNILSAEFELLLSSLPFAVLIADENDRIIKVNNRFREFFAGAKKIVAGETRYYPGKDRRADLPSILTTELRDLADTAADGQPSQLYIDIQRKEILDRLQNRVGFIVIFRDVTDEHNKKILLEKHAYQDELTGLFNRRYFYEKIAKEFDQGGLLYLDLDKFKFLNDQWGHQSGDECLQIVGKVLHAISRDAVRMGGDEFAIYLPKASAEDLEKIAAQIKRETSAQLRGHLNVISLSIGLALSQGVPENMDELVHRADSAMYANKRNRADLEEYELRLDQAREDGVEREELDALKHDYEKARAQVTDFTWYQAGMEDRPASRASRRRGFDLR
ncbi:MAG: diguanylate cyclase [Desulfovibrio sp.]|nr:diguanylate cyclase [Desulfovibrio sp.]